MASYRISWTLNAVPEQVSEYIVHASRDGGPFEAVGRTASNSFDYEAPGPGKYDFALQAVNFVGVSALGGSGVGVPSAPLAPAIQLLP